MKTAILLCLMIMTSVNAFASNRLDTAAEKAQGQQLTQMLLRSPHVLQNKKLGFRSLLKDSLGERTCDTAIDRLICSDANHCQIMYSTRQGSDNESCISFSAFLFNVELEQGSITTVDVREVGMETYRDIQLPLRSQK